MFRTVTENVNCAPAAGLLSLTDGDATVRSAEPSGFASVTVTANDEKQLFVVSDSSATGSTHAP